MTAERQGDRPQKRQNRSQVTLYDAVAGRANYEGFLTTKTPSKNRDTISSSTKPVPADEILFRRKGAPTRYAEDDVYAADRHLRPDRPLPDSDLLKALHAYAADYYGVMSGEEGADFRSLDETALLAMGILIEEAAREVLRETGALALAEVADEEEESSEGDQSGSNSGGSSG